MGWFGKLIGAREGSVAVLAAMSLTAVLGMSGLAAEMGNGYVLKVRNQRVADAAALAAALSYKQDGDKTKAEKTATDVALASGLQSAQLTPTWDTNTTWVAMTVRTGTQALLGNAIGANLNYTVAGYAKASLAVNASPACVTVLGTGNSVISAVNSATLDATGCAVKANGKVSLTNSSTIKATKVSATDKTLTNGSTINTQPTANNFVAVNNAATDTLMSNAALKAALCQVNKMTGQSDSDYSDGNTACTTLLDAPDTIAPGGAVSCTFNGTSGSCTGVTFSRSGSTYTIPAGTYLLNSLSVSNNASVTFSGPTSLTVNSISVTGATLNVGDGTVQVSGALSDINSGAITLGTGYHAFGSISLSGSTLIAGGGSLNVTGKISASNTSTVRFALNATADTVKIGGSGGVAISASNTSTVSFVPASGAVPTTGKFSANGDITMSNSCTLVFNKTANHLINGDLTLSNGGANAISPGTYIVSGSLLATNSSTGIGGTDVSFVLGGHFALPNSVALTISAPTGSSGFGIANIAVATKSSTASTIDNSSGSKFSGYLYMPNATLSITNGGNSVDDINSNGSGCFYVMVDQISLTNSSGIKTGCLATASGMGSSTSVALVQ